MRHLVLASSVRLIVGGPDDCLRQMVEVQRCRAPRFDDVVCEAQLRIY
jgi:hypothetical protein